MAGATQRNAWHVVQVTLFSSYANVMLVFVFLGILAGARGWEPSAVFLLNFLAIFPLASLLSFATEELSKSVGQTVGGLINATFGNAVEMIVGITAVTQGEINIVQSSMVGSILSGTLLVLGCCFLGGGYGKETISFNVDVTQVMSSLMIVASTSLIIPSALYSTTLSELPEGDDYILTLSHITAIFLLIFYLVYLNFQLKSHAHLFASTEEESDEKRELEPLPASIILILATLGVTVCSDYLVEGVDGFVEVYGVSRAFLGMIVVPIVGNAGEFAITVNAAMGGKLDLAIGVIVGSTLQIALFVTPFLVICGWVLGQPMSLRFNTFETACFSLAVVVMNCLTREGKSNYFEGLLLIGTYLIIAIAFYVHPDINTFDITAEQLSELIESRSIETFHALGGLAGLEKGLRTDRNSGLSVDESTIADLTESTEIATGQQNGRFTDRTKAFGTNHLPVKKQPSIFQLMWMAYNDHVLFFLTAAAIVSLALGLYQALATKHSARNPPVEWVEGVSILVAIIVIVLVGAANDFQKQIKFQKLNKKKLDRNVTVVRSGHAHEVPISDLVVGDVVHVEPGDVIPADGVLIQGYHIRCDEASATGESDLLRKHSGDEVLDVIRRNGDTQSLDPFIISGSSVAEGVGSYLVIATGTNSSYGKILLTLNDDPGFTPLQTRLNVLAKYIANFGGLAALVLFIILFIKFLASLPHSSLTPAEKGQQFLDLFIISLTVVVIAVPEGLPLTVTLALAFATTRMLKDHNLVRMLRACETMGNATDICSDKTGTLTQNKMTVVAGVIGTAGKFVDPQQADDDVADPPNSPTTSEYTQRLAPDSRSLLRQSISLNSTAFENTDAGTTSYVGSKTEAALLTFARDHLGMSQLDVERSNAKIVEVFPFENARQCMVTVAQLENGRYRAYVKGAPEVLLDKCIEAIEDPSKGLSTRPINADMAQGLRQIIADYASKSWRTIIVLFRDFDVWPPLDQLHDQVEEIRIENIVQDLTFLSIMGIRDPLRNGARDAVQSCHKAGVAVRIVTGDNLLTAKAIAEECGILTNPDDVAMEGREFRQLGESQQLEIIPRLKVLARSSPEDKRTLVRRLKEMGRTVAVTGDGTNDAPALTAADVGFSMGISGTEVAREASSIVLMDDNFSSIVRAIMWGRAVSDAVKKFLQFQITITFTSVGLAFVSSVASSNEQSVLTAVQLMWVNLFQDTLAALALATDPPSRKVLDRKPEARSAPLITIPMWKMIIGQSIYQLAVTLVLHFAGSSIFSYTPDDKDQLQTAVFNTYVWMQIFNMYNNRQLENSINLLEGVSRNWLFICVTLLMMGCQVLIIFVGGRVFSVVRLTGSQWAYSVVLGALSILIGFVIKLMPDGPVEWVFDGFGAIWSFIVSKLKGFRRRRDADVSA
ncbi:plasma membrane calcium-transporting ATPase [Aspergillus pseudonomiae]|uniref:Calcium-transporting ATPase n=1 Tax=Aspergillus pseudonomiae TaxID=1506151 RepID=A0A5N6HV30_9EURO|nr:plasma membrane calcium-transporting ATPase [Aspergillus pseudonomiae]KAB8256553.1 plasma membrane calcium-transporting ATPase [Aspergillus pseudonomiae]KAE8400211.1 plasma membrane calcium-transporting ATPase [Aspergillus pseudonomiae]